MDFPDWLDEQLQYRGWTRTELSQRAGFSSSTLSLIFSNQRNAGVDVCRAIAKALRMPESEVFRAAGLLAPDPGKVDDPQIDEILRLAANLTEDDRQDLIDLARSIITRREREAGKRAAKSST